MGRGSVSSGDQYKSIAGKDDRRERERGREGARESQTIYSLVATRPGNRDMSHSSVICCKWGKKSESKRYVVESSGDVQFHSVGKGKILDTLQPLQRIRRI
jgi:hypothetical protein